jgi:hypothetical protein
MRPDLRVHPIVEWYSNTCSCNDGRMPPLGLSSPLELLAELKRKVRALHQLQFQVLEIVGALQHEPRSAKAFCKELAYRLDQGGPEPKESEPVEPRNVVRRWQGGRYLLFADVDAELGAKLDALIDPLAKPGPQDVRFAPEREGEAFCELVDLALRSDLHRIHGGERVELTVTVDYDKLRAGIGTARLDNGEHIPMKQVRRIACDAGVIPMLLGSRSQIHDVGRKTRTINAGLRRMLVARDGGCAFPGVRQTAETLRGPPRPVLVGRR